MKKRALILLALLLLLAVPVHAQSAWQGAQVNADVSFGSGITFTLRGQAPAAVQRLELLFRLGDETALNRVEVPAPSSASVSAQWAWDLLPGEVPPGRLVTYWWRAETSGGTVETDPATAVYADERFNWQERDQGVIHLFWYAQSNANANRMMTAAQDALQRLEQSTGANIDKPVSIFLYDSKSDMSQAIPSRSESYDVATVTLGMAMGGDTIVLLASASGADRTVAHELSHIVVGQFTDNPFGGLPVWLDEGLAMYAEGDLASANASELQRAIRTNTLISVRSLSGYPGDPTQVDLFYGENYSVVKFLIDTYGADKMDQLLQTFKQGVYQEDALQQVYGFGIDGLEDEWRAAIGAPPRPTPAPQAPVVAPPSRTTTTPVSIPICSSAGVVLILAGAVVWRRRSHSPVE